MQNVQNVEIQQRVINLVELYRTKVGKESKIAKEAKAFYDQWLELNNKEIRRGGDVCLYQYQDFENPNEKDWIDNYMVNEQLLGHFYAVVAGENAEKEILDELLPEAYNKTVFTEEEETFLSSNFKEMVNYIILTPCDEDLKWVNRHDGRDALTIPNEVLELIGSRIKISSGSKIYYPYAGLGQFTNLFEGCKFLFQNKNAWIQVALFANAVDADFFGEKVMPISYDCVVSYLPAIDDDCKNVSRLCEAYIKLPVGGKFITLCPNTLLSEESYSSFRKLFVDDKAIMEIIQLPKVMSENAHSSYCIIIAEKNRKEETVKFIDASFAQKESDKKNYKMTFDIDAFNALIKNGGVDESTGFQKLVSVHYSKIDERILSPNIYVIERPSEDEHPVPLSSICQLVKEQIRDVKFDLPLDTPYILHENLSSVFKGALDFSKLDKIGFPNNPSNIEVHDITEKKVIPYIFLYDKKISYEEQRIALYRSAIFLDGKKDAVLWFTDGDVVKSALYPSTGKDAAVGAKMFGKDLIHAFYPNQGFDALSLLALLNMPIVYRQLVAYESFGLEQHLDDIFVPTSKRIINDEVKKLIQEQEAYKAQEEELAAKKTEYINEIRMRKHDMRPHMKQLNSAKNLMQHYVDNLNATENVQEHLNRQLTRFKNALGHLSDIIEHLSDEEQFGDPERFSIMEYFKKLITESINDKCDITFNIDSDTVESYLKKKLYEYRDHIIASTKAKDQEYEKGEYSFPTHWSYAMIAPLDFDRMVQNILENARRHGFTDSSRSDYKIWIIFSVDEKRDMYVIDFKNNGTPLPNGMNKERYGLKGEKAGVTGGTGSGGYIVKSIVNHYGGDYDVFFNDDMTTIRVWLPIATI